jgi:hypothetical protein
MKTMNTTRTGSHLRAALKHPTLAIAFAVAAVLGSAQAAIPIGPSGSGTITFDTLPAATEWATTITPIPGNGGTAVDLTGLDTLVKTLAATGITAPMGTVAADPAGTTTQDGKWNSAALRLTSRAGTSAATCFMATLANTSGAAINEMDINFTLSGSAPAGEDPGMAGYALYYSLTGATSSWQRIGVYGTLGAVSVTNIPLSGPWAAAANLYVLWVDDNGNNGGDGWYGFDDVSFGLPVQDGVAPTLTSITDDKSGGSILTYEPVTYTVTFSEAMRTSTVNIVDFENDQTLGSPATVTINSVVPTADPLVYLVSVTPTGGGSLRLQIKQDATLTDYSGTPMVTTSALPDDTTLTVTADTTAPSPSPMTFEIFPTAASISQITMTATTASDASAVQYYFTETTGNPGATSSGWQNSPVYTDSGLTPGTSYTYTVKARDMSSNETTASAPASATTDPETNVSRVWNVNIGNQITTSDNFAGAAVENTTPNSFWNSVTPTPPAWH